MDVKPRRSLTSGSQGTNDTARVVRGPGQINNLNNLRPIQRSNFRGLDPFNFPFEGAKCFTPDVVSIHKPPSIPNDLDIDVRVSKPVLFRSDITPGANISNASNLKLSTRADFLGLAEKQEEPEEEPKENTKGEYKPPAGCERPVAQWCTLPKIENNSAPTPRGTKQMKPETKPPTDPLPLCPPHLVQPKLYPYRYCSAGPTESNGTRREELLKECARVEPKPVFAEINLRDIRQHPSYVTTSLTESCRPFRSNRPPGLAETPKINPRQTFWKYSCPYKGTNEFSRMVLDDLHPNWRDDPKYRRRCVYRSSGSRPTEL